jgi:septum formation protein
VHTAVAVARGETVVSDVETVGVTFRELSDDDIAAYVATGEPTDKAGAYGIQGFGATIVTRVDGDYFAVMGLALGLTVRLLGRVGVRYRFGEISVTPAAPRTAPATPAPSPSRRRR